MIDTTRVKRVLTTIVFESSIDLTALIVQCEEKNQTKNNNNSTSMLSHNLWRFVKIKIKINSMACARGDGPNWTIHTVNIHTLNGHINRMNNVI